MNKVLGVFRAGKLHEDTQTIRNNLNNSIENVDIFKNDGIHVLEHLVERPLKIVKLVKE